MRKEVMIISNNKLLSKTLRRSLKAVKGITVLIFSEDALKTKNKIILIALSGRNIQEIFYEQIRSKYLNPVIVIGFQDKDIFFKEFPLFNDHPYNHNYMRIPFDLLHFTDLAESMIPISSQAIRKAICGGDQGYKGYLRKLLSHDLLKDKDKCIQILNMVGTYLDDKEFSSEIKRSVLTIRNQPAWSETASDIGNKLQSKLQETCNA